MQKKKKSNSDFFWVSYADLMTTLFFIMLTLFILTVVYLKVQQGVLLEEKKELERIVNIRKQFAPLKDKNSGFVYLESCEKYVAKDLLNTEIFNPDKYVIKPEFKTVTLKVGRKIERILNEMRQNNPELKYLVVLEGNVANNSKKSFSEDSSYGYKLSYNRALAVYNLWLNNGINFRGDNKDNDNIEVLISGSGFNGLCRDDVEENNKRFSIQIIPKVKPINE